MNPSTKIKIGLVKYKIRRAQELQNWEAKKDLEKDLETLKETQEKLI